MFEHSSTAARCPALAYASFLSIWRCFVGSGIAQLFDPARFLAWLLDVPLIVMAAVVLAGRLCRLSSAVVSCLLSFTQRFEVVWLMMTVVFAFVSALGDCGSSVLLNLPHIVGDDMSEVEVDLGCLLVQKYDRRVVGDCFRLVASGGNSSSYLASEVEAELVSLLVQTYGRRVVGDCFRLVASGGNSLSCVVLRWRLVKSTLH